MSLLDASTEELLAMLAYESRFPDFPKNFTLPYLTNPHYVPPTNCIRLEVFAYVMAVFTTSSVVGRLWIRKKVKRMVLGMDDWLVIPGQVRHEGYCICVAAELTQFRF